jgi:hypothetical protein
VLTLGAHWTDLQRAVYCGFDLPAIKRAMDFLKQVSPAESVVFTDDWDIFPAYFYYNHHNHYIVGLDPKFTHEVDPELWERYVQLTRGKFPGTTHVECMDESGKPTRRTIRVQIEDIIDHFGCRYVVTDRDHKTLARKLERDASHAELIWPQPGSIDDTGDPPYKIFRVFKPDDGPRGGRPSAARLE